MILQILIDLVVILLLVVTLVLGVRLQRRLNCLRRDGGELTDLIATLDTAVGKAEAVLDQLKRVTLEHGVRAGEDLRKAERLRDDLAILGGRAEREADRLAGLIADVRTAGRNDVEGPRSAVTTGAGVERIGGASSNGERTGLERTLRTLR